nr:MAG TPA: putative membrane protein [Caudoviricetes sp.]
MNKIGEIFNQYFEIIFKNKKYILIFALSILFFTFTFFKVENYISPKAEILLLIILFIFGLIAIIYSFKHKNELHKVAFIIILLFGILTVFTTPTLISIDENEHFARSDMTSLGILIPEYQKEGYVVSDLVYQLQNNMGRTIVGNDFYQDSINNTKTFYDSGFPQNPFYGYIFSGLGILLAKLLDLSVIGAMWLGRLFNLLLYAGICALGIKKAPNYKMALLVVSCLPMSVFQAASFSVDGVIYSFCILSLGYFIYMYKTSSLINYKDIGVFFISILLVSFFKFPYGLFAFFIFLIPKEKFASKKLFIISRCIPVGIMIITMAYSLFYASHQLENTGRQIHFIQSNVSPEGQINYMINNPLNGITFFLQSANLIPEMVIDLFRFSFMQWTYNSFVLSVLYLIFFSIFSFIYPHEVNFKKKNRLKIGVILVLIYIGIIFIQYLSWASVGYNKLDMLLGVYARYYIPLLTLCPLICYLPTSINIKNFDLKILLVVIIFLSGTLILTISTFY